MLEAHHIVPVRDGGTHDLDNIEVLCRGCHVAHHRPKLDPRRAAWARLVEDLETRSEDQDREVREGLPREIRNLEAEHRAALLAEPDPEPVQVAGTPEDRERLELRSRFSVANVIRAGIQGGRVLRGSFPYNSLATVRDRGRVRKERFRPGAFRFSVETPDQRVDLIRGHNFDQPLGRKPGGGPCGVPPVLAAESGHGTARREAWRQFLFGVVAPVAKLATTRRTTTERLGWQGGGSGTAAARRAGIV